MNPPRKRHISLEDQKFSLLYSFTEVRECILQEAAQVKPELVDQPFLGSWDILKFLAHLRGWDFTNLEAAKDILKGKLPDFYARYDKDWAAYNARLVAQYRCESLPEMLQAVRDSQAELLDFLERLTPAQVLKDQGVRHGNYKVIISRLIAAETRDEKMHLEQLMDFIR